MMNANEPDRWEVYDRYGNKIYMTAECWHHVVESRPWLTDYHNEVLTTLRQGRRKQDTLNSRKYKYYWPCNDLLPDFNHFVVVVLFGETTDSQSQVISNNFVVTAWTVFIYSKR